MLQQELSLLLLGIIGQGAILTRANRTPWDVVVKTCDQDGAGTDASVYLKLYYQYKNENEVYHLDNPKRNDFERDARDHFKVLLNHTDIINVGAFWWPGFSLSQHWCLEWILLLDSYSEKCIVATFNKWVLHYSDPPTYASSIRFMRFADCTTPGSSENGRLLVTA